MEMRRGGEVPEEVKKEIMPDGRKRYLEEDIPTHYVDDIKEQEDKKNKLLQQSLGIGINIAKMQKYHQDLVGQIDDVSKKIQDNVNHAFKKMKLAKKKGYKWDYKQKDYRFVGLMPKTPPPTPPKGKVVKEGEK